MSESWRLFVAVPIGDDLRGTLASAVEGWRARPDLAGVRWSDPDGWHLTLAFLGATDPAEVGRLVAGLRAVAARHEPMRLATGGLGGFPSPGRARVAWYGVDDREGRLAGLAAEVRVAVGLERDAAFRAHLTLGRARSAPVDLRGWIGEVEAPAGRLDVDELDLVRSHLGGGPVRHETIAAARIGVGAHV